MNKIKKYRGGAEPDKTIIYEQPANPFGDVSFSIEKGDEHPIKDILKKKCKLIADCEEKSKFKNLIQKKLDEIKKKYDTNFATALTTLKTTINNITTPPEEKKKEVKVIREVETAKNEYIKQIHDHRKNIFTDYNDIEFGQNEQINVKLMKILPKEKNYQIKTAKIIKLNANENTCTILIDGTTSKITIPLSSICYKKTDGTKC